MDRYRPIPRRLVRIAVCPSKNEGARRQVPELTTVTSRCFATQRFAGGFTRAAAH